MKERALHQTLFTNCSRHHITPPPPGRSPCTRVFCLSLTIRPRSYAAQVCQFQRLCFKHWSHVESLYELSLSNCGAVEQRDNLRCGGVFKGDVKTRCADWQAIDAREYRQLRQG